ncbi:lysylphosphatidylglycerol synthase transmembrane domain-containing protein [Evansella tamaricis]|uniref:Phosphatidylglycerol lysyltransferase n=1 Tax=Evansella tamaricis TaxID=2069301 RepID=A0ABS6JD73_9BACI|nr:lysylphosphatidylglycerol synthase transmembrane domain-containing protein [Evansella tamaricis]MBU9710390.1 flippase-like domain-containing protein [Evansella tamaricis]
MKKIVFLLIGILLVCLFVWKGDFQAILASIEEVNRMTIISLCLLQVLTIFLVNYQWFLLGKPLFPGIKYKTMFRIQMVGTVMESITPAAKTGGEAVKVILMKRRLNCSYGEAVGLISVQKLVSMLAFVPISSISIIYLINSTTNIPKLVVTSFLFIVVTVAAILFLTLNINSMKNWLSKSKRNRQWPIKFTQQLQSFETALRKLVFQKTNWFYHFFLSFVIWGLFPLKAVILNSSLHMNIDYLTISAISFIAYMISMLPLTPGGLGTFEGSVVIILGSLQIGMADAIILAVLFRFVTYWFVFFFGLGSIGIEYAISFIHNRRTVKNHQIFGNSDC